MLTKNIIQRRRLVRYKAFGPAILAIALGLPNVALAKFTVNGSQTHTIRRAPDRVTMRIDIAGSVPRFQPGTTTEVPRAGATANDQRIATKRNVYDAITRLVPGARVIATHAAIAPRQLNSNGVETHVWTSNQAITIEAPLSKTAAFDRLRDTVARIDGVQSVSHSSSSVSPGRLNRTRNRAEVQAVKTLSKRATSQAPDAVLTQLALGAGQSYTPQPFAARGMALEAAAAPAESHYGDNAVSASVSGTWQKGGTLPAERKISLSQSATAKPRPDLGGIVISNRSEAPTQAAAVDMHNTKWARVNQLVRQHLGSGYKTVGDSAMVASDSRYGNPASAAQSWTINNVKLAKGGDAKLYALRKALAEENIEVRLTSGLSASRYNAARSGVQKTAARRATFRAQRAATAAGAGLDLGQRDFGLPAVGNEDNLNVASGNRFDVPIQIQTSGSYGFGVNSR
jgi:hypothetical protein